MIELFRQTNTTQGKAMRRRLVLSLLLSISLLSCSAVGWAAARPPIAGLVTPDAREIHLQGLGWGQWLLTYEAAGARGEWYYTIATRLADSGWSQPSKWGPPPLLNTYTLVTPLWIGSLWQQVELRGEANRARIIFRRWIVFPENTLTDYVNI
jgi:hypothetical protein